VLLSNPKRNAAVSALMMEICFESEFWLRLICMCQRVNCLLGEKQKKKRLLEDAGFFYSANCSGINGEEVPGRIWVF
jgi:hypothetical protein